MAAGSREFSTAARIGDSCQSSVQPVLETRHSAGNGDGSRLLCVPSDEHQMKGDAMDLKDMSQEELLKLVQEKGIKLTDEQLDSMSGGRDFIMPTAW